MADRPVSSQRTLTEAKSIAAAMPDMLVAARRVSATVLAGWHGRRTGGRGETFWQFRPFVTGEAASMIDWRRSARDEHLFVREKEWEAAHTLWLWPDLSRSMDFRSRLAPESKRHRAIVLALALADLLATAGERVGLLGASDPLLARNATERLATALPALADPAAQRPQPAMLRRFSDVVLFSDFLEPYEALEADLDAILRTGARAHLVQVIDPSEETFPFAGRTEFIDPETGTRHVVGRAEQYRDDYRAELSALRERLRTTARRLDWTFLIHRTDRPATEPLLTLHRHLADRQNSLGPYAGRAA